MNIGNTVAHRMVLALILAGLVGGGVCGCGEPDRFVFGVVEQPIAEMLQEGSLEVFPFPAVNMTGWVAVDVWPDGEFLMATSNLQVYRYRDHRFVDTGWPGIRSIRGLVCLADGTAWGMDVWGQIHSYDGSSWRLETNLEGNFYWDLVQDQEGRLVALGGDSHVGLGRVFRRQGGVWQELIPGTVGVFVAGWASPELGLFLVDSNFRVHRETADGWTVNQLSGVDLAEIGGELFFNGDSSGHLVLGSRGEEGFWTLDDDNWVWHPSLAEDGGAESYFDLFWQSGCLFSTWAWDSGLFIWDGIFWRQVETGPEEIYSRMTSLVKGDEVYLLRTDGLISKYLNNQWDIIQPHIGEISGVAEMGDAVYVLTTAGSLFVREGEAWRWIDRPVADSHSGSRHTLFSSGTNQLVVYGSQYLLTWRAPGDMDILEGWVDQVTRQHDGKLLVVDNRRLGLIENGELNWVDVLPETWRDPEFVVRTDEGSYWLQDYGRIGYLENESVETILTLARRWCKGMMLDPVRGLVVYGYERILLNEEEGFRNVTPYVSGDNYVRPCWIRSMCLDGLGRWVGWDYEGRDLLRYDGEFWNRVVTEDYISALDMDDGTKLLPTSTGGTWIYDRSRLLRYEYGGQP